MPLTPNHSIFYPGSSDPWDMAASLNTMATSIDTAIGNKWTAYTPTLTNATYTSGQLYYTISGNVMNIVGKIVVSAVSGVITFTIPSGWNTDSTIISIQENQLGIGSCVDTGIVAYPAIIRRGGATTLYLSAMTSSAAYVSALNTSATVPFTWGAGDAFTVNVTFPVLKV